LGLSVDIVEDSNFRKQQERQQEKYFISLIRLTKQVFHLVVWNNNKRLIVKIKYYKIDKF
jgi:hypothetical protein